MDNTNSPAVSADHPLDVAARALGGRPEMAKKLRVTVSAIGNWKNRGVPVKHSVQIERLVPFVTRQKLHPEDWQDLWPELATQPERKAM